MTEYDKNSSVKIGLKTDKIPNEPNAKKDKKTIANNMKINVV
jgi:hypothetical protein